jgi:hypothetical protein
MDGASEIELTWNRPGIGLPRTQSHGIPRRFMEVNFANIA